MQINMLGRAEGKTYNATFIANELNIPILGINNTYEKVVKLKAQEIGLEKSPTTYNLQNLASNHPDRMTDCIIDEVSMVLAALLRPYNLNPVIGYDSPPKTEHQGFMVDKIIEKTCLKEEK